MAVCERLEKCPFFNDRMADMPATAAMFKKQFCEGDFMSCARRMVAVSLSPTQVPSNLFPNEIERARKIIAGV